MVILDRQELAQELRASVRPADEDEAMADALLVVAEHVARRTEAALLELHQRIAALEARP